MSTKSLNRHLFSLLVLGKRSMTIESNSDLGKQMKLLNDKKQFKKALELFDNYTKNQTEILSSLIITQALKACAQLQDVPRGERIHRLISSNLKDNTYVLSSLIHLYMQCDDIAHAKSLFDTATHKTLAIYGAMMKGYIKNNQSNKAIDLFHQIEKPNEIIITILFNACAQLGSDEGLHLLKKVYQEMPQRFHADPYLLTSLLDAFMKCGDVSNAELLFDKIQNKLLPMYGAMMKGYIKNNEANKAVDLFHKIKDPNDVIFILLFNSCAQLGSDDGLHLIKNVSKIIPKSYYSNPYLLNSLLDALVKCGDITYAQSLFDKTPNKLLPMYGAMMKGYIKNNQSNKAIDLFHEIEKPNEMIITLFFNACAQLGSNEGLNLVKKVYQEMPQRFHSNPHLLTSLLDAFMKCGDVSNAELLFDKIPNKVLPMYGAIMTGYIKNNRPDKTLDLFKKIKNPSEVNIIVLFNACADLGTSEVLHVVKTVLEDIPKSFHSNIRLLTSALYALIKCGDIKYAELLFNSSINKDLGMYGVMMKGYIKNNQSNKAIDLFHEIEKPNEMIITILFNACAQLGSDEGLNLVKKVYQEMPERFHSNPHLLTSLLDAFMKCGDVSNAELLFDKIPNKVLPMYGAMMKGYIKNNQSNKAVDLFHKIKDPNDVIFILLFNSCAQLGSDEGLNLIKNVSKIIPKSYYSNPYLLNSLLDALIKCGDITYAQSLFDSSIEKDSGTYAIMMNAYNKENNPVKTLNLFYEMKDKNYLAIYIHVIKALSQIGDYKLSQSIVEHIPNNLRIDSQIQTVLIDMWGKSGSIDKAKEIFEKISQPNQYQYAAIINSYGLNGMGIQAIEIYRQMPFDLINEIVHISIINACSHSGFVQEARSIFENISMKTVAIYTTMIDCLSRASLFQEAENLQEKYECSHPPSLPMNMALLSGARNQMYVKLARQIYDRMNKVFSQSDNLLVPASILLANVYTSIGDFDKASDIKIELRKSGVKKKIGLSWTVVDGQVYQFRAHDVSHSRSKEIYAESEKISAELVKHGHQYDSSWVTRPLSQDETIATVLCGHSERLAIAWNFVANPNASRIQITKNLRVCGDCHRATKLIAFIRQCEIIVRDANRIHHFYKNGQCSCNDYF